VRAAVAAGLRVVGLTTGQSAARLRAEGTEVEVPDFDDPTLWALLDELAEGA
jgi:beta-phosphoglucomutase-like phosphatase (HAD superfamily)